MEAKSLQHRETLSFTQIHFGSVEAVSLAVLAFTRKKNEGKVSQLVRGWVVSPNEPTIGQTVHTRATCDRKLFEQTQIHTHAMQKSWKPDNEATITSYRFMITLSLCLSHFVHLLYNTLTKPEAERRRNLQATYSNF